MVDICNIAVLPGGIHRHSFIYVNNHDRFAMDLMPQVFVLFHLYYKYVGVSESEWGMS